MNGATTLKKKILIVDDDKSMHVAVKHALRAQFDCFSAYGAAEVSAILNNEPLHIALVDMNMAQENEGLSVIGVLREAHPDIDIIVISANTSKDSLRSAIELGASTWLVKDFSTEQLLMTVEAVLHNREIIKQRDHFKQSRERSLKKTPIIGVSTQSKNLGSIINKARRVSANVLITGETGTGKELVARHIGEQDGKPFVAVDSATITSSMAESLLFGHEKGAFTGATCAVKGLFEEADGGTIYFDEVANMPLDIQAKLLRVIQEKQIMRVGARRVTQLDFRVIAASNKDLEKMSENGEFKYDLLQRINVLPIQIAPLKIRKDDLGPLIKHFISIHLSDGKPVRLNEHAMQALVQYDWPGNVRELSNVIAYLSAMFGDQDEIGFEDLPQKIQGKAYSLAPSTHLSTGDSVENAASLICADIENKEEFDFYALMHSLEGKVLFNLLSKYGDNMTKLSRMIKVSRSHLYSKLNAHGLAK